MTEFEEALLERVEMLEVAVTHITTLLAVADLTPAFNSSPEDISDFHEARGELQVYCNEICDGLFGEIDDEDEIVDEDGEDEDDDFDPEVN